jgi:UDP-3-O-[3-hydroxymyristoyl] glucosamine N-acyltransferase
VTIGEETVLVVQAGNAGNTEVRNHVSLGDPVGGVGHIQIGDGTMVGAQSGLAQEVAPDPVVSGSPAFPHRNWLREQAVFPKLPEMKRGRVTLEKKIAKTKRGERRNPGGAT